MNWNDTQENAWHEAGWGAGLDWPHLTADEAFVAYFARSGQQGPREGGPLFTEKMTAFGLGFVGASTPPKRKRGRPPKGTAARSVRREIRMEPDDAAALNALRLPGETRNDADLRVMRAGIEALQVR